MCGSKVDTCVFSQLFYTFTFQTFCIYMFYLYVYNVNAWCLRSKEGTGFPEIGVRDGCESLYRLGNWTRPSARAVCPLNPVLDLQFLPPLLLETRLSTQSGCCPVGFRDPLTPVPLVLSLQAPTPTPYLFCRFWDLWARVLMHVWQALTDWSTFPAQAVSSTSQLAEGHGCHQKHRDT